MGAQLTQRAFSVPAHTPAHFCPPSPQQQMQQAKFRDPGVSLGRHQRTAPTLLHLSLPLPFLLLSLLLPCLLYSSLRGV